MQAKNSKGLLIVLPRSIVSSDHIDAEIKKGEKLTLPLFSQLFLSLLRVKNSSSQVISNAVINVSSLAHCFVRNFSLIWNNPGAVRFYYRTIFCQFWTPNMVPCDREVESLPSTLYRNPVYLFCDEETMRVMNKLRPINLEDLCTEFFQELSLEGRRRGNVRRPVRYNVFTHDGCVRT